MRRRLVIGIIVAAVILAAAAVASAAAATRTGALQHPGAKTTTSPAPPLPAVSATVPAASSLSSASVVIGSLVASSPANRPNPKGQYDLSWTLPTAGKSGCLVCHGDPNLVRIQDGKVVSLSVDYAILQHSAHVDVQCTGCHIDFAYKVPHENARTNAWKVIARSACKNCHSSEFADYTSGVHSPLTAPGVKPSGSSAKGKPSPLCGDCHGSHSIPASNTAGQAIVQASGVSMCGQCHELEAADYSDYYHGAAYKKGAPDAPACWNCHDQHATLPSSDPKSSTNPANLAATCGGALAPNMRCHANPGSGFIEYSGLIHGRIKVADTNPLLSVYQSVGIAVEQAMQTVTARFGK